MKKIFENPSFWLLLAGNLYIFIRYIERQGTIDAVIFLYLVQSILLGLFNALSIVFYKPSPNSNHSLLFRIKQALFFLFHFSFFNFMLYVFLANDAISRRGGDWKMFQVAFWLLVASMIADNSRLIIHSFNKGIDIGKLFFLPYLRVVPIGVIIFCITYLPSGFGLVFLVLKIITDIGSYMICERLQKL